MLDINLTHLDTSVLSGHLKMGGTSPHGVEINANSRYLTLAGKPWLPVMGEFHFTRYPQQPSYPCGRTLEMIHGKEVLKVRRIAAAAEYELVFTSKPPAGS